MQCLRLSAVKNSVDLKLDMSEITERRGTIGVLKGAGENEVFQQKANFALDIVAKVEGNMDGYIARVTRAPDNVTR